MPEIVEQLADVFGRVRRPVEVRRVELDHLIAGLGDRGDGALQILLQLRPHGVQLQADRHVLEECRQARGRKWKGARHRQKCPPGDRCVGLHGGSLTQARPARHTTGGLVVTEDVESCMSGDTLPPSPAFAVAGGRMTRIMIWIWLAAGILSLALPAPALAQTQITTAVIEGVVVDASGAVLPGVDVEVRNVDTNFTRSLTSDRDGRFVALQVPPGRYTVTFSLAGFATLVQEDVLVTVGESVRLNAEHEGVGRGRDRDRHHAVAGRSTRRARPPRARWTRRRSRPRRSSDASSRTCSR